MAKKYFSVDVETLGPVPGKYSMVALGACLVDDISRTFYREIKPLGSDYSPDALKVVCRGLKCLKNYSTVREYDPDDREFKPLYVVSLLMDAGSEPKAFMHEFDGWVRKAAGDNEPVIAAAPVLFDGRFISHYFDSFGIKNPFDHSGEDINSMYRGYRRDTNANIDNCES